MGILIIVFVDRQRIVDNNVRRLEVLRNCINFVFDNKILDVRIVSSSIMSMLLYIIYFFYL